jgi:hypothetical protein
MEGEKGILVRYIVKRIEVKTEEPSQAKAKLPWKEKKNAG